MVHAFKAFASDLFKRPNKIITDECSTVKWNFLGLDWIPPVPCEMPISTSETSSKICIIDSRVLRRELLVSYFEKRTRIIPLNFGPRDETEKLSHYISRFATRSKRFSCYFPYMYRVTQKKDTDVLHRGVARYCVVLHSIE